MITNLKIENILFLDIETVPLFPNYTMLDGASKMLWDKKSSYLSNEELPKEVLYERAGIYAEFGRVLCICVGKIHQKEGKNILSMRSFFNEQEDLLLNEFSGFLNKLNKQIVLCAHNGKEFDFPYLCRRFIINQIELPECLNIAGKKPWEIKHLDTMELWKFGDYKHYTSLELLAHTLNIPTPKDDIDGSQVNKVYYQENDPQRIIQYCFKDVITIAQLFMRFKNLDLLEDCNIVIP